ncbi:hypothetical protein Barb6_00098 [Bacteroidales bacterium Barb6]|nr:hypothetical protein Barb6_00098 [Bacteroidales bacterium Barb6]
MEQINWIVTSGKAEVEDNIIRYKSEVYKNQLGKEEILTACVKSNVEFDNGEISFKLNSSNQYGRCYIFFSDDDGSMILIGLINVINGLYGIAELKNNNFKPLSITGLSETFQINKEYDFTIKVYGSQIDLYVNGVLVAKAYRQINKSQITFFFSSSLGDISVKNIIINTKKSKAFIVMQFTDEYNHLYSEVIKPVVEESGFECERADEAYTTNPILQDIIQSIRESSIIIADITPNNPNVFYEVGYAHAINMPTILLCDRKREELPFDISGFRTLFYDNTIAGKTAIEKDLRKYLKNQINNVSNQIK